MGTSQPSWPVDRRRILKTSAAVAAVHLTSPFIIIARGETPVRIVFARDHVLVEDGPAAAPDLRIAGTMSVSMKSGTNEIHGTGYYFGRNPALNAVVNPITRTPNFVRNHIWGGTTGGPVTGDTRPSR